MIPRVHIPFRWDYARDERDEEIAELKRRLVDEQRRLAEEQRRGRDAAARAATEVTALRGELAVARRAAEQQQLIAQPPAPHTRRPSTGTPEGIRDGVEEQLSPLVNDSGSTGAAGALLPSGRLAGREADGSREQTVQGSLASSKIKAAVGGGALAFTQQPTGGGGSRPPNSRRRPPPPLPSVNLGAQQHQQQHQQQRRQSSS